MSRSRSEEHKYRSCCCYSCNRKWFYAMEGKYKPSEQRRLQDTIEDGVDEWDDSYDWSDVLCTCEGCME